MSILKQNLSRVIALVFSWHALSAADLKQGNAEDAVAKTPEEQRASFVLPEGFVIELVASEETGLPKPVMVSFDDAGRLWSVTATEYPRDKDPEVWKGTGKDRVVVIDEPHLPGPHLAREFAGDMVMPLSVLPYGDGAYVAQGPEILFLRDKDGDGKADEKKVLISGFGVQDTHTMPHQLVQMPGRRIVFSQGVLTGGTVTDAGGKVLDFRKTLVASMQPDGADLRIIAAGLNNIWAWVHDRTGQVFIHEANDFGYSVVPFEEDTTYPSFIETKLHPQTPLHPPTAEGLNLGGTGFSGLALCDDKTGTFPAPWHGTLMVANPILGKIQAVSATPGANGVWTFQKQGDLVSCQDPMFRPVAVTFGPDGCLYITDWYNRIISHNEVARDHPARDKERGRIWRVRHVSQSKREIVNFTKITTSDLPAALQADSTWAVRAAWHQIGQRQDRSIAPVLVTMVRNESIPLDARIHALWSLEDLGFFDADLWRFILQQPSPALRREAVRALSSLKVLEKEGFLLLQALAKETAWPVRYEVLRYFRRAAGPVQPDHVAWLRQWSVDPAPQDKVNGWNGPFFALGGSYERAFQDFLLTLAETKTSPVVGAESKWDKVLVEKPAPTNGEQVVARKESVKQLLAGANQDEGRGLVETVCLSCHSLGGKGVGFAPPLDGSGNRELDGLLTAIIDPDAAVENVFRLYRIERKDGRGVEGFKRKEDESGITILLMGGVAEHVPFSEIKAAGYVNGKSTMLDVTGGLPPEKVAAMVSYLMSLK